MNREEDSPIPRSPLKSRSLEYLTSDRKKLPTSEIESIGTKTRSKTLHEGNGKEERRLVLLLPPPYLDSCDAVYRDDSYFCRMPMPKKLHSQNDWFPYSILLFTFLHNNNDSLSPVENGEKPRSQRLQWSRITWKFGTRREWCDNGGGGTANRSVWSGKWRTGKT